MQAVSENVTGGLDDGKVHAGVVQDGGDEEPTLPGERLECEATQEELQTQGQGLQSRRQGGTSKQRTDGGPAASNNPAAYQANNGQQQQTSAVVPQRRVRRSKIRVEPSKSYAETAQKTDQSQVEWARTDKKSTIDQPKDASVTQNKKDEIDVSPNDHSSKINKEKEVEEKDPHQEGTKLGHYVFGKSLGKGTFGKVKMAEHILTKENVAIKILEKARIKDRKDIDRISREIKILKKVRHPNVIQLYEIIETETELYLIMEYCVNGELFDYIVQHQRLHEKAAIRIYQQLICGIEYIHKSGICHRDLKPENLLLDFDKTLKIVDFGLSNSYEPPDGLLKTACGSPCYAAPEMIAGKKYLGLKSDIWSSGVVLYAMVCGFLPFEDPKTSNLYKKIMAGEFKLPRFLSTDCSHFISKILVTDPASRYGIEQIREHPWYRQFRDKQPVGLFPGRELMPLEDTIYEQILDEFGFDPDYAVKCIEANRHNNITATYHLLYKRALRQKKPFTNMTHVTGSLDRAACARYERMEVAQTIESTGGQVAQARQPRYGNNGAPANLNDSIVVAAAAADDQVHKRGTSTTYYNYRNQYVLQSVNGGPETADLQPNQAEVISVQKRYKMELQAEISKLRHKYPVIAKKKTNAQETSAAPVATAEANNQKNVSSSSDAQQALFDTHFKVNKQVAQKRTERFKHSRQVVAALANDSRKVSPDTVLKRPQNRVNIIQIQNQQLQESTEIGREEFKQNSQVIGVLPSEAGLAMMPQKMQKQVKQYSSQPGNSGKQRLMAEEDEYVFAGSEIEEPITDNVTKGTFEEETKEDKVVNTLQDQSAQKVTTISSLGGATKSNANTTVIPSATTNKGSQVLRSHIKKKRPNSKLPDAHQEFLNSSMPINLPTRQQNLEPFNRAMTKSGGRKIQNGNHVVPIQPQMRYRQQKTASVTGTGSSAIDVSHQFNTIGDTGELPNMQQVSIRSKKNQQYVSLNANQAIVNNSLDLTNTSTGGPGGPGVGQTYSTIAAGQSSKNFVQISMNQRQIEHLSHNLNKTQNVRAAIKADGAARTGGKYNLNRASLGGIIGQQKHLQAQRAKQANAAKAQGANVMPSIHNGDNFDQMQVIGGQQHAVRQDQGPLQQHPSIKHRASFKQTTNNQGSNQLVLQDFSPQNAGAPTQANNILARRAGSQQWRNNSNLSNRGGRDSVNSNNSANQQTVNNLFSNHPPAVAKRPSNMSQQPHNSQLHVAQQVGGGGDYDFQTVDAPGAGMLPYAAAKHHLHPGRVITASESGQVGSSKPLQLSNFANQGFIGQTSENQMNLHAKNTIDFHHMPGLQPGPSNPQSNSRVYSLQKVQDVQALPNGNKAQQMKNRKGINKSIDLKPHQVQQIKQGLRASSQIDPQSHGSRKSAQSRQFAFESELSNNYASQISGWVNQSILQGPGAAQNQTEILDQSAASIKQKVRHGRRDNIAGMQTSTKNISTNPVTNTTKDSQSSYNMQQMQIYQQFAAGAKPGRAIKTKSNWPTPSIGHSRAATVLDKQHTSTHQTLDQLLNKALTGSLIGNQNSQKPSMIPSEQSMHQKQLQSTIESAAQSDKAEMVGNFMTNNFANSILSSGTPSGQAGKLSTGAKSQAKPSQVKKQRIDIPGTVLQKGSTNVRTTPVQQVKKQFANQNSSGSRAVTGGRQNTTTAFK